jgi:DnaK suppressor protein
MRNNVETSRTEELRNILTSQRRRILDAVRETVHAEREAGATRTMQVEDAPELSDSNLTTSIDFSLAQMRSEMLDNIDDALRRLALGRYGVCVDCDAEISAVRLAAIPFATRCRNCAEDFELSVPRAKQVSWERSL